MQNMRIFDLSTKIKMSYAVFSCGCFISTRSRVKVDLHSMSRHNTVYHHLQTRWKCDGFSMALVQHTHTKSPYQKRTPTYTRYRHDCKELAYHLRVERTFRRAAAVFLHSGPQKSESSHTVTHKGDEQSQESQYGEDHGEEHIQPVAYPYQTIEAPATGVLYLVRAPH